MRVLPRTAAGAPGREGKPGAIMPSQLNLFNRARLCGPLTVTVAILLSIAGFFLSQAAESPITSPALTNIYQIWELPRAERAKPHRIKT